MRCLFLLLPACFTAVGADYSCRPLVCVQDFHDHAIKTLDGKAIRYIDEGATDMITLKDNVDSFKRIRLRPRNMMDVSKVSMSTTVLGSPVSFPVGVSPAAGHKNAHPEGENATAKACSSSGVIMIVSVYSTISLEDIAAAGGPNLSHWQQLHIFPDRNMTLDLVRRAEAANAKAIVLTIDDAELGLRYTSLRDRYWYPPGSSWPNFDKYIKNNKGKDRISTVSDPSVTWKDLQWLKNNTKLPIVVKGVLTGEEAKLAISNGASAILVSNHGGRQLDGVPSTINALPEVISAVGKKVEVYLDSGVRSGSDVFKALALGARAVFVGRPILWGLSYNGTVGGSCVLDLLKEELRNTMTLTGFTNVSAIDANALGYVPPYELQKERSC